MDYVVAVQDASPQQGLVQIDADTSMSPGSFEAASADGQRAIDYFLAGPARLTG